jgi:beta-lactamase class A
MDIRKVYFLLIALILGTLTAWSQASRHPLRDSIVQLLANHKATVGVAIWDSEARDTVSVNGDLPVPMQSVFKCHIGWVMLSEIDKGRFTLDQRITILPAQLLPDLYSPLREKYPLGGDISLREILEYTLAKSDNVGCDVMLKLLGGTQPVEAYFAQRQVKDLAIRINEEEMQGHWDWQFRNWTTPRAANQVLKMIFDNPQAVGLSADRHAYFWGVMKSTETGPNRLKGLLPEGTVVAHKTGWSGTYKTTGITAATNDIGVVFLPNGRHFFISVFVTDSRENMVQNEKIIAQVARAAWDYFLAKKP